MCGRTSLFVPQPRLEERFGATASQPIRPRYNVAPGDDLAVVRDAARERIDPLAWGLVPRWADVPNAGPRPINARAETLADKPAFRDAYRGRGEGDRRTAGRCLVLADGYYEWQARRDGKQPYRVHLPEDEPFAMAGLWDTWEGDGETRRTVTVVTTDPNDVVEPIHDRMPAVLEPDEEDAWLDGGGADLLDPYPADALEAYPVSTRVNDPANDDPRVVEPLSDEQSGLDEFA